MIFWKRNHICIIKRSERFSLVNNYKKEFWFYIEPYVYITKKKEFTLFYNGYTNEQYIIKNSEYSSLVSEIIDNENNLRVIKLTENDLNDLKIGKFVSSIREKYMGDLLDTAYIKTKPVQNIQKPMVKHNINILKEYQKYSIGESNILEYINEISLYINNECCLKCNHCDNGFKQFLCCTKNHDGVDNNIELSLEKITELLKIYKNTSLTNLNILGGNILNYSVLTDLIATLNKLNIEINYYVHHQNLINFNKHKLAQFNDEKKHNRIKILIDNKFDEAEFINLNNSLHECSIKHEYIFIVQSEEDFNIFSGLIEKFSLVKYNFKPYYNGSNIIFFEKNVYLDYDQLNNIKLSIKEIIANHELNKINFGRLIIFPNGKVYANSNAESLGNIDHDDIIDIVYKELYEGRNWLLPRKKKAPCNQCIYETICPPISNYEYAIGKHNLCHIDEALLKI